MKNEKIFDLMKQYLKTENTNSKEKYSAWFVSFSLDKHLFIFISKLSFDKYFFANVFLEI